MCRLIEYTTIFADNETFVDNRIFVDDYGFLCLSMILTNANHRSFYNISIIHSVRFFTTVFSNMMRFLAMASDLVCQSIWHSCPEPTDKNQSVQ